MYDLQLSQLMPLHYRHGFHSRLADLNKLLRYFLGSCVNCMSPCRTDYIIIPNIIYILDSWVVVSTGAKLFIVCVPRYNLLFQKDFHRYNQLCSYHLHGMVPLIYFFWCEPPRRRHGFSTRNNFIIISCAKG